LGFGNKFVRQANAGAIAAIGATSQTLEIPNDVMARALTYTMLPGNFSSVTDMNLSLLATNHPHRIGDILNTAKMVMEMNLPLRTTAMTYWERYNLAGDPTINVLTNVPSQITATYQKNFPLNTSSMAITSISCGSGMATLVSSTGVLLARQAFVGGSVTLSFSPITTAQTATLTISAFGYKPLLDQIIFATPTGFTISITPSPVPNTSTPVTLSYTIPAAYNGATVKLVEHRQYDTYVRPDINGTILSGTTGYHSYSPIWFWTKGYFGKSVATIDLQVNGIAVVSTQISFGY
jgi:hypothetical protein